MDKVEKARVLFAQLESRKKDATEIAKRSFEIRSRLGIGS